MRERILSLPLIIILMGLGSVTMYLPAAHAAVVQDYGTMRAFFQAANMFAILTIVLGIATSNRTINRPGRSYLLALMAAFVALPLMLAVPFSLAVPDTAYLNAYVEMVSDFSTTGLTLFDDPLRLPPSVHLWRALVGWMGGLFILVAAVAILAPMNLGGFEVLSTPHAGRGASDQSQAAWHGDGSERLTRYTAKIFPIYAGLTLALWIILLVLGDTPLVAISHAMSVLSTSGISPIGGLNDAGSGMRGEAIIFLVLMFAISRQAYAADRLGDGFSRFISDPEFRLGLFLVAVITGMLFLRHWVGALDVNGVDSLPSASQALWGGVFTVMSFLTTTGFESMAWSAASQWSGLETPGILLMGLALIGGGVATTAGGVKLLRVYALYKHGTREMDRLVHPSSVGGSGIAARRLRRQGAHVAWVFFMLFAISIAVTITSFGLAGIEFETSITLAVASLSTTGPLINIAAQSPIDVSSFNDATKLILAGAMVLGRLETLAIIALLNPGFWRK
ncbi:MAG: potassium transporter TrkG [Paracoccaceae bacterium]